MEHQLNILYTCITFLLVMVVFLFYVIKQMSIKDSRQENNLNQEELDAYMNRSRANIELDKPADIDPLDYRGDNQTGDLIAISFKIDKHTFEAFMSLNLKAPSRAWAIRRIITEFVENRTAPN